MIADQLGSIKALVVNSVEGLPYDNVTVTLFAAESIVSDRVVNRASSQAATWALPDMENISRLHMLVIAMLLILLLLLAFWKKLRRGNKKRAIAPRAGR